MKYCRKKTGNASMEWFLLPAALPADWDEILPENHYLKSASLHAHEAAGLRDVTTICLRVKENETTIALAAFQLLSVTRDHISDAALKPWQQAIWKAFTKTVRPRILIAGHLYRHDVASFYWLPAMNAFSAFTLYQKAIDEAVKRYCPQGVLVKDTPAVLAQYFQNYAPQFLLLRNDISMEMAVPQSWQALPDYEKSLKHKYAQRMRKVRASWSGLDVRELSAADVLQNAEPIYQLYLQVAHKQSIRLGILTRDFLPALKKFYGEKLKIWGVFEGETMIAFASGWLQETSFDMFYIGFEYAKNNELQLYFNILFFSIEQATHFKKEQLILGRTALEAKARVGCKPHYLNTFLWVRNKAAQRVVRYLQQKVSANEGAEWENRHPFK